MELEVPTSAVAGTTPVSSRAEWPSRRSCCGTDLLTPCRQINRQLITLRHLAWSTPPLNRNPVMTQTASSDHRRTPTDLKIRCPIHLVH